MLIELLHVPLESSSLGTWVIATQDGFLRRWDVVAGVQMPFVSCVLVLADQSDQEVVHSRPLARHRRARCVGSGS